MTDASEYTLPSEAPDAPRPKTATDRAGEAIDLNGLPASLDSERTILGCILLDNSAFNEAIESISASDFALTAHQTVFRRMGELIDAGIAVDIVTLAEELTRHRELESVGGVAWLASLTEGLPRRLNIAEYVAIIREKSQFRRIINLASLAITRAADKSEKPIAIVESLEGDLLEIAQESQAAKLRTVADSVQAAGGIDHYVRAITEPEQKVGLPTGFVDYDRMTGGLQKQELTIIAARPSMGKTALGLCIGSNVAEDGNVVALFSLEMSRQALERRLIAAHSMIDVQRVMRGDFLRSDQREKITSSLMAIADTQLFIDDSSVLTPTQLRAKCRRLKQQQGRLDLVLVDYLGLMSGGARFPNRREEVESISRALKQCAKELDAPVIALAQLNRQPEQRVDKRPVLSDLRDSGSIEQDADLVAMIHREGYYKRDEDDPEGDNIADILICKQRNGATGVVKLGWIGAVTKFVNLAYGSQ